MVALLLPIQRYRQGDCYERVRAGVKNQHQTGYYGQRSDSRLEIVVVAWRSIQNWEHQLHAWV